MMRRIAVLVLVVAGLAVPALGAEAEKAVKPSKSEPGTSVEMTAIISPMLDADGKLAGYAYVTTTIVASSPDTAVAIRNKFPFIQDAFVRDVNARTIALPHDPTQVDKPALVTRFLADARQIMGANRVVSLEITQI